MYRVGLVLEKNNSLDIINHVLIRQLKQVGHSPIIGLQDIL